MHCCFRLLRTLELMFAGWGADLGSKVLFNIFILFPSFWSLVHTLPFVLIFLVYSLSFFRSIFILLVHTFSSGPYPFFWSIPFLLVHTLSSGPYPFFWSTPFLLVHTLSSGPYPFFWSIPFLLVHTVSSGPLLLLLSFFSSG